MFVGRVGQSGWRYERTSGNGLAMLLVGKVAQSGWRHGTMLYFYERKVKDIASIRSYTSAIKRIRNRCPVESAEVTSSMAHNCLRPQGIYSVHCRKSSPSFLKLLSCLTDDELPESETSFRTNKPSVAETTLSPLERQQQLARNRSFVGLYFATANEVQSILSSRKNLQSMRYASSGPDKSNEFLENKNKTINSFNVPVGRTEKDFADYLTSSTASSEKEVSKVEAETSSNKDWVDLDFSPENLKRTTIPDNHDAEKYRSIRRKQERNLETSRARTAHNVRRALAGNVFICAAKLGAWISSGSSSMLSEFVHSVVDCGNQALLLIGLRDSRNEADRLHPYGYGKSIYFWALVSALGTFFLGSGLSMTHAVGELMHPSLQDITWEVWAVLGVSFAVDGYVLGKTISEIKEAMPSNTHFLSHVGKIRDPAILAVLLEDGAACLGVLMALSGIAATHITGQPIWDGMAGVMISGLLGAMGIVLVKINHRFLLGQAVDREITEGIEKILLSRRSIDNVYSVQSQWTGPATFSYKAEVDFDGTFLAAKLMPRYQKEFLNPNVRNHLDQELRVLLSWYAEDVMRTVEREVRHIEAEIRTKYPGAEFIELEPMSKEMDRFAVDDGWEAQLRRIELERLNRYLKSLYPKKKQSSLSTTSGNEPNDVDNVDTENKKETKDGKWTKKKI